MWSECLDSRSQVAAALRPIRAAIENSRWRSFLGFQVRAGVPANTSTWIQAVSSVANWAMATKI
jgi:hypothetical protein